MGIGHLLTKSEMASGKIFLTGYGLVKYGRDAWPEDWCEALLRMDLRSVEAALHLLVRVALTQPQYDALCCWTFNVGNNAMRTSTLLAQLNTGHYDQVPVQMRRWVYAGGRVLQGLKNRREREIALWEAGAA
mgnify:FL=1